MTISAGSSLNKHHAAVVISADDGAGQFEIMSENNSEESAGEQSLQVDLAGGAQLYVSSWSAFGRP